MSAPPRLITQQVSRTMIVVMAIVTLVYFAAITTIFKIGSYWLFGTLIASELFHIWQGLTYAATIWKLETPAPPPQDYTPPVDICITVCGEPVDLVHQTVVAAKAIDYPDSTVWLLNDGRVAHKDNWQEIEQLAHDLGVGCITRSVPGGAKAGNINNALKQLTAPVVAIFDADHVPHSNFLRQTVGYLADPDLGFVQTPQYYANHTKGTVAGTAWEQQEIFFGPIMQGKQHSGSAFMCGTNMVIRREALEAVGGMNERSIAEDFVTSLLIHAQGYRSVYVPEILAEGLAPEDFASYYKQQYRWARGSLEMLLRYSPLRYPRLSGAQKIQYLASVSYYLSGWVVIANALLPLAFFYLNLVVFRISTMTLAAVFLPYIFLSVYLLQISSNFSYTFRALSFSMGSFPIHIGALISTILRRRSSFSVTPKRAASGNFLYLVIPHLVYIVAVMVGIGLAWHREGASASMLTNAAWALFNVAIFSPFILASLPHRQESEVLANPEEVI